MLQRQAANNKEIDSDKVSNFELSERKAPVNSYLNKFSFWKWKRTKILPIGDLTAFRSFSRMKKWQKRPLKNMREDSIENNTHLPLLQFATSKVIAASEIYIPEGKIFKKISYIKKGILRIFFVTASGWKIICFIESYWYPMLIFSELFPHSMIWRLFMEMEQQFLEQNPQPFYHLIMV